MGTGQLESRRGMPEGGWLPGRSGVADPAVDDDPRTLMIRGNGGNIIFLMAGIAFRRGAGEGGGVALRTDQRCMSSR